jgi:hypothetical protein
MYIRKESSNTAGGAFMCAQELVALFRFSGNSCPACQRIVSRYERTLNLTDNDIEHLENCILKKL